MKERQKLKSYQNNHTFVYRYLRKSQPSEAATVSHSLGRAAARLPLAAGRPWAVLLCPEVLTLAFSNARKLRVWITSLLFQDRTNAYWYWCRMNTLIKTTCLCILNVYVDVSKTSTFTWLLLWRHCWGVWQRDLLHVSQKLLAEVPWAGKWFAHVQSCFLKVFHKLFEFGIIT